MIYNQQYLPPTKSGLSYYLDNYISYITKNSKSKVVKNRGMNHGLFGCIDGKHLPVNIQGLNKAIKYVKDKSQKGSGLTPENESKLKVKKSDYPHLYRH